MKKLLLALGFLGAFVAQALAVVATTTVNNSAYTILPTDVRIATGPTAFTASRTWTLPSAGQTCIGQTCAPPVNFLEVLDIGNAISLNAPLVIAPASGENINGSTSSITISITGARIALLPVSASNWQLTIVGPTQPGFAGTAPSVVHSGGIGVSAVATGNDSTAVNTETYIVEVFVPVQSTLTGVSWLGLATSTGNVQFSLADSTGKVITGAQTASTATTGTANYQQAAFAATYLAAPGKYFILMQNSGSNHYRAHILGNFGASKKTGETYGTFTNVTAPTTFTTNIAPIADLY